MEQHFEFVYISLPCKSGFPPAQQTLSRKRTLQNQQIYLPLLDNMDHFRPHTPTIPAEEQSPCPTAHLSYAEFAAMFPKDLKNKHDTALGKAIAEADTDSELWRHAYKCLPDSDGRLLTVFPDCSVLYDTDYTMAHINDVRQYESVTRGDQMYETAEKIKRVCVQSVRRELAKVVKMKFAEERAEREKGRNWFQKFKRH